MPGQSTQQATIHARLPIVALFLIFLASLLIIHLANFQFFPRSVRQELERIGSSITNTTLRIPAERGLIYDRDGEPLTFNVVQYRLGVSPNLVFEAETLMKQLSVILDMDEVELFFKLTSDNVWEFVAGPISAEQGQAVAALDDISLGLEEIPRRFYPQGSLAAHVIGIVLDDGLIGTLGVEGAYNSTLAGRVMDLSVSNVPFDLPEDLPAEQRGQDIVLTLDRDVQFWMEVELERAVKENGAFRGSVIVMDPRNGEVLALANYPSFDPNNFLEITDPNLLVNPVVQETYEPGSLLQVLTAAAALESGAITPEWSYNDVGVIEIGGREFRNRYFQAHGVVDIAGVLTRSLHVGSAAMALEMGEEKFYNGLRAFGLGQATGVGLFNEDLGELRLRGDTGWTESTFGLNSYGQAMQVTQMQMITAFAAIANDGIMRQPHLVRQIIGEEGVRDARHSTVRRVLSPDTASILKELMVRAVREGAPEAYMSNYTVAGKPGTAQINTAIGYETGPNSSVVSFIGFLPADEPAVVAMVKLDRPDDFFGFEVAAPVFRRIADRLVILLEIPDDATRRELQAVEASLRAPRTEQG
ncbi:MAG: penicillin-binding protein 2 [Chloroflexi bacterium]|nr:penicillin-binding protein 2 [Chloroflexota bacterium]MCY4246163.1 penicillin-binding protein 2 [Chloroflexota bacterium]